MKRWMSLLLALALCLPLCACGGAAPEEETTVQSAVSATEPTAEPTAEPTEATVPAEPTEATAPAETEPVLDYHQSVKSTLLWGGYQVTAAKAVAYDEKTERYSTDYVPAELAAEHPEEIYYVVYLRDADKIVGYYGGFSPKSAVKPGIRVEIQEVGTGKILAESEDFMGGDPPETIDSSHSGRGTEPDETEIKAWIRSALENLLKNPPAELPNVSTSDALTDAYYEAYSLNLSYKALVEHLMENEGHTQADAEKIAEKCGADWNQLALYAAMDIAFGGADPDEMVETGEDLIAALLERGFTQEEAEYAVNEGGFF